MASHSNQTQAHDFYYKGVNHGLAKEYSGCTLNYDGNKAMSYSTLVALVIPARGRKQRDVKTSDPSAGLTLTSFHAMSSTTSRHTSYLRSASPFYVVKVPLERGRADLDPKELAGNFLRELELYSECLNTKNDRDTFIRLMGARKTLLDCAAEEWAKPLRDKRFRKFEDIDIGKAAADLQARNRREAVKRAAETRALFAKYVKDRSGADYCEFVRVLCDDRYDSPKYRLTREQRQLLRSKLKRDDAYVWVDGDELRTSKGVRVDAREARVLLKAWAAGKDMRAMKIGYYTIISYTGDHIKIGCHNIPRENMLALYEALVGEPFPKQPEQQTQPEQPEAAPQAGEDGK